MTRLHEDPRNEYLPKSKLWRTKRQYMNAYAAKHGAIALELRGWVMRTGYPTMNHLIIAYKTNVERSG